MDSTNARLRKLPSVDRVIEVLRGANHPLIADAARRAVDEIRARVLQGEELGVDDAVEIARQIVSKEEQGRLRRVINATGVIIHTNLGRVPLGSGQTKAALDVAGGYSNLEFDLDVGRRGSRHEHCRDLLRSATGAEDALVVNNNAAAVLVTLAALSGGREVVVSRGELIEIGGEFRLPDVMLAAGVELVEVGTTNRTHLSDYEKAVGTNTGALLKVHPANYTITGFTAAVSIRELARVGRDQGIPLICDLGSGLLVDAQPAAQKEPVVAEILQQGADLATFSGDKLLGGAQAGLIVGRGDLIARVARHPLMRAVRVDKMTLGVLQHTLLAYLEGTESDLPLWQMMNAEDEDLRARAVALATAIDEAAGSEGIKVEAARVESVAGGGALPGATLPSWGVLLNHPRLGCDEIAARLRRAPAPVVVRIDADRIVVDLRTVMPAEDATLTRTLVGCLLG